MLWLQDGVTEFLEAFAKDPVEGPACRILLWLSGFVDCAVQRGGILSGDLTSGSERKI